MGTDIGLITNNKIKVMEHLTQNNIILLHEANQLRSKWLQICLDKIW